MPLVRTLWLRTLLFQTNVSVFFSSYGMRYFARDPAHKANDRFVLSKGHAAPILYAAWERAGFFNKEQLMTLRYSSFIVLK